ncbi:MAG: hypothetical protein ACRC3H_12490 [Lachnospiraceae bacterium]
MENKNASTNYGNRVHIVGIISSLMVIISLVIVPLGAQILFKQDVDWGPTLKAMGSAALVFGPVAVIEFLSYLPIIGAGGQYLSFTTGNVMNMKLPAATSGRKIAEVEEGTEEGDVVSMVSIAVSSITTTLIVFIGMIVGAQILPVLQSDLLSPAFNNVMPAIMGALGIPIIVKSLKLASVPVALSVILTLYLGYEAFMAQQGNRMILFLIVSLLWAYILYRRNLSQSKES